MEVEVLNKNKIIAPKLRFKEFDENWKKEKLETKVNSISSGKIKPNDEGDYFVYGSTGIIGKSIMYSHDGDYILVARVGANAGYINRVKGKFAVTDNTLVIDLKKDINVSFCQAFLTKYNLNKLIFGSGQPLITGGLLKSIEFVFPSLPEQQKIASFLSAVDEKIQLLTRKKELLTQYKKGVMQQLFSGKLRFKDEQGKDFPDWEMKRLKDVVESDRKIRYGVVQPGEFDENGRLLVRGQDYSQGWADVNSLFRVSEEVEKRYSKARLKYQDLVITIVGAGTGYVAQVPKEFDDANITQTTARIAIDKTNGEPYYYLGYLRSSLGRKLIYSFIKGAAQPGLNVGDIEIFKVNTPCLAEQKKIANYLSNLDVKIDNLSTQISQTQTFKKGLLQQMFV